MEHGKDTWQFEGFSSPNFTSVPDEFFDVLAPRLNGGEVKVLLYIIRRTFGFKKDRDNISLSQMLNGIVKKNGERLDHGAGMSKPSLCRALITLTEKHIIIPTKQFDFNGGCVATSYQLSFRGSRPVPKETSPAETPGKKMRQGGESQNVTRGVSHNLPRPLVKKRDTQYTVNNKQLNNNVNVATKNKKGRNILHGLEDKQRDEAHIHLIAEDILAAFGDKRSEKFYLLVARKVPEATIRKTLSELKQGGVTAPERVFTSTMMEYATRSLAKTTSMDLHAERVALEKHFKKP